MQHLLTITGIIAAAFGLFAMWVGLTATDIQLLLGALIAVGGLGLIGMGSIIGKLSTYAPPPKQLDPQPDHN